MGEYILKVILPQCLSIGISYELFWTLNPKKLEPFYEAERIKQEEKYKDFNYTAWLNGVYVARAIPACFPKGTDYPSQPIDLTGKNQLTLNQKAELWALAMNEEYYRKHPEERPT